MSLTVLFNQTSDHSCVHKLRDDKTGWDPIGDLFGGDTVNLAIVDFGSGPILTAHAQSLTISGGGGDAAVAGWNGSAWSKLAELHAGGGRGPLAGYGSQSGIGGLLFSTGGMASMDGLTNRVQNVAALNKAGDWTPPLGLGVNATGLMVG